MMHTAPRAVRAQRLNPHPTAGELQSHRDELRNQPGWLDMPHPSVSPARSCWGPCKIKILSSIQQGCCAEQGPSALTAAPECWGEHEPSPPPLPASSKQHRAKPPCLPLLFSLCLLFPLRFHPCIWGPWSSLPWCHPVPSKVMHAGDATPVWGTRIQGIIKINLLNRRYFPLCAVPGELGGTSSTNTKNPG